MASKKIAFGGGSILFGVTMNGATRWKVAFLVLASFVAGAVTGAFFIMGSAKDEMRRERDPLRWFTNTPDRWRSEMKLTPDQDQKIRPILQQIDDELTNRRAVDLRETEGILSRGEDRLSAILTPEQRPQLHQTFEQRRQRIRDWMGVNDRRDKTGAQ
jgi:Spy/CpxP family protein refolding chaperone